MLDSTEGNGRPRITETANFDFRNDAGKVNEGRDVPKTDTQRKTSFENSQSWLVVDRVDNKSISENDNFWSERKRSHQVEEGLDVARRLEKSK